MQLKAIGLFPEHIQRTKDLLESMGLKHGQLPSNFFATYGELKSGSYSMEGSWRKEASEKTKKG